MHILIVGWYGTETVGDKAILAGIILEYQKAHPDATFTIASIHPPITQRTLKELQIEARIVATYSFAFVKQCATSDYVVMGGGPLMDMESLAIPLWAFIIARAFGKKRIVYGCGIGPLKQPRYIKAVTRILRLATDVKLRDSGSVAFAKSLVDRPNYALSGDPSLTYLHSIEAEVPLRPSTEIAMFVRDWPREYALHLSSADFELQKQQFEVNLASFLRDLTQRFGGDSEIVFYPMHCFVVGNDDRNYARQFVSMYLKDVRARVDERPSSVKSIVQAMRNARLCVCMRFHSVVFAKTLGCKFLAIDYTAGGKIYSFLKDNNALDHYARLEEINQDLDVLNRIAGS